MNVMERDIEGTLIKKVKAEGGMCLKWVCPGWSGVPDRIILLPGGRILFAETKRPKGGRLSKLQEKWHVWLKALGFTVFVVWTKDDVTKVIEHIRRNENETD